jgi:hypothetical protein
MMKLHDCKALTVEVKGEKAAASRCYIPYLIKYLEVFAML